MGETTNQLIKKQRQNLLLSFGLGAMLVAGIYLLLGQWPFGDGTMLTGDLNGQYVTYLADLKNRLGEGGFFYSFAKLCGGSTLGLFAYYMFSPFNLLILLLPTQMIPVAVQLMFLMRVAFTSTACCFFLQKHCSSASRLLPFLSQAYGLCAFCVVYSQNIIWMDVVMLAPLMLWAVEKLVDTGTHWPVLGLTAACALLNFYTAWSVCLFSVIYFLYYWVVSTRLKGRSGTLFARRLGKFAASGILGAGISMALLYPALLEIEETKGSLFTLEFSLQPNFDLAKLPYQLFFGNFFWSDVTNGLPNLYCGVFCAVLVVLFFLGTGIKLREKLAALAVLAVMVLSFWVNGINLIWHGFKEPVWFPYRYSFLVSLFLVLLAAKALLAVRPKVWAFVIAAAVGVCWLAGYAATAGEEFSIMKILVCAGVLFGTLLSVWMLGMKKGAALVGAVAICAMSLGDMALNSYLSLRKFETYSNSGFVEFYNQGRQVAQALKPQDPSDYRIEKNFMRTLNDPMLLGYWGISHFSSTKASTAKPMLEQLGYVNYTIYGWGSTAAADSLLGIKYLYTDGSRPVPQPYVQKDLDTGLAVYENPYALPMAYTGNSDALQVDVEASGNTFELQNQIFKALVPSGSDVLLPAQDVAFIEGGKGIQMQFTAPSDGPCYLAIPDTDIFLPADVKVDGTLLGEYFQGDSLGGVFPLGSFAKGQKVDLVLGFEDKEEYRSKIQVYSLEESALEQAVTTIRDNAPNDLEIREGGHISLSVQGNDDQDLLVLPFAYEDSAHWSAVCNGQKVAVEQVFGGMMGVRLVPGENNISFSYHHPGVKVGAAISVLSVAAAGLWYGWQRRTKAKQQGSEKA